VLPKTSSDFKTKLKKDFRQKRTDFHQSQDKKRKYFDKKQRGLLVQNPCQCCCGTNENYKRALKLKYSKDTSLIKEKIETHRVMLVPPEPSPSNLNYRTTVKLAVRSSDRVTFPRRNPEKSGRPKSRFLIGLFAPGTHDVMPVVNCLVQSKVINRFLEALQEALEKSSITPWSDVTKTGDLRYLVVRSTRLTSELMLTFVVNDLRCKSQFYTIARKLSAEHGLVSCFLNVNDSLENNIWGSKTVKIMGKQHLRESMCGLSVHVSPRSFLQTNPSLAEKIYRRIELLVDSPIEKFSAVAWDLYSGIGQISMMLSRSGYRVVSIEESRSSVDDCKKNIATNAMSNHPINVINGKVESILSDRSRLKGFEENPSIIVVNPSKSGLLPEVIDHFLNYKGRNLDHKIIYVSCNLASLLRDIKLLKDGGYTLKQLESFDMFPHTNKLEWLAVLAP